MWDFPRIHIAIVAFALVVALILFPIPFQWPLGLLLLICGLYQSYRIFPYTRFAAKEIELTTNAPPESHISVLAANVLMENANYAELIQIIKREDPDVLFLMETDQVWLDKLQSSLRRYTTVLSDPRDNLYGLIFATKLPAINAGILFLSDDDTPSVQAELQSPDGVFFNFIGLHPRPPIPGNDTVQRDEQIKSAADTTKKADWQTVCVGDFNDVAWSSTSERFKRNGQYLEPRVGRGMFATFHAMYWFLRFPIDQVFLTRGIGLVEFERLEPFGSDHFPIKAVITFHNHIQP